MMLERAKQWVRSLKRDVMAIWIAARDPRTPFGAKIIAAAVAAYALSPIDLIPDFIPILGYLDELMLLPLGILITIRLIPPALMAEFRERASEREGKPKSIVGAAVVILIWFLSVACITYVFGRH